MKFVPTHNPLLRRLRWLMICVILFDTGNTLLGQPAGYWQNPLIAREGNQFMRQFMVQGYLPFLLWSAFYVGAAFLAASFLPRRFALCVTFSFILGHYYGASTWLWGRWAFGAQGPILYGIILAIAMVLCGVGGGDAITNVSKPEKERAGKGL